MVVSATRIGVAAGVFTWLLDVVPEGRYACVTLRLAALAVCVLFWSVPFPSLFFFSP